MLVFFFLMIRRPPRSTRTDTLFPYTTLFRSLVTRSQDGMTLLRAGRLDRPLHLPATAREVYDVSGAGDTVVRSEEHTSELQSLMRISYAVFCLKKKKKKTNTTEKQNKITKKEKKTHYTHKTMQKRIINL